MHVGQICKRGDIIIVDLIYLNPFELNIEESNKTFALHQNHP